MVSHQLKIISQVFEPPFLTTFFATTNALSGYSWEDNKKKISSDFLPTCAVLCSST